MQNSNALSEILLSDLPKSGYLRISQLIPDILPFSHATLWRKVKSGGFPKPIKLSERITAFRTEDVRAWLDNLHKEASETY